MTEQMTWLDWALSFALPVLVGGCVIAYRKTRGATISLSEARARMRQIPGAPELAEPINNHSDITQARGKKGML